VVVILVTVYIFPSLSGTSYGAHPVAVKYASIFVLFSEDGLVNMVSSAGQFSANLVTVSKLVFASVLTISSYQFEFHVTVSIADIAHDFC
jgi:hypothetical protein